MNSARKAGTTTSQIMWRRLDGPGGDVCRLVEGEAGWTLEGTALFVQDGDAARLDYRVVCDPAWRTQRGRVQGWIGGRAVDLDILRTGEGAWRLNGTAVAGLEACLDLDLGFTPATNLIPIRRLELEDGASAQTSAAWLDVGAGSLAPLAQLYSRLDGTRYHYEAPRFAYTATLEVTREGFVRCYPGLWEAVFP